MKKTLLAAALVAGFAGVAHAESSVTLYGLVDAGYGFTSIQSKHSGDGILNGKVRKRENGVQSGVLNGNRWGLKGKEDLGNGTSAIFVLESGFTLADGRSAQGGRLFGRQAYVGLTGDSWGTFTIGRQYNAGDTFVAPIDPFGTGGGFAAATQIFGSSLSDRYDGVIKYVTPNFNGFQFGVGLVHSDDQTKKSGGFGDDKVTDRTIGVTTGLGYTSGPIYVGASFDYLNKKTRANGVTTKDAKTKAWNVGATYDFDVVKLHLMYGGQHDGTFGDLGLAGEALDQNFGKVFSSAGLGAKGFRQHSWLGGLSAPVGDAGKVMFSYAGNTIKNKKIRNDLKIKSHNFALGYRHSLSKRTSVYGLASYGWSNAKDKDRGLNSKIKTTVTQAVIGLQHRF
ncbi:Outer membrane porin protein [Oligella sp. MSHR50489EDL]|uniref:porin n=1 Tax=Oligella sp. MSHR50489EDL TaxID=3139409 RepID=UPI003D813F32